MSTTQDAARMLAEVRAANVELAKRAVAPVWYHPALGLLCGGAMAIQAAPIPARLIYMAVFALGLILLVRAYRRKTGLWVSGFRRGRTRWMSAILVAILWGGFALAVWLEWEKNVHGIFLIGGILMTALVTAFGFAWEAAFRRDLRDEGGL